MLGAATLDDDAGDGGRARWGKLGAALIFVTVLLCGSLTAAYSGWQWVTRDLRPQTAAGRVDVTGNTALDPEPTPAVYVVMTATPQQVVIAAPQQPPAASTGTGAKRHHPCAATSRYAHPDPHRPRRRRHWFRAGSEATGTGTQRRAPPSATPQKVRP